jgi:hypothetical protein
MALSCDWALCHVELELAYISRWGKYRRRRTRADGGPDAKHSVIKAKAKLKALLMHGYLSPFMSALRRCLANTPPSYCNHCDRVPEVLGCLMRQSTVQNVPTSLWLDSDETCPMRQSLLYPTSFLLDSEETPAVWLHWNVSTYFRFPNLASNLEPRFPRRPKQQTSSGATQSTTKEVNKLQIQYYDWITWLVEDS